jgi:hypothetical protein
MDDIYSTKLFFQRFYISLDEEDIITPEIEKHMVAEFSVLELHLKTNGHVFGAFAFHLLGMNRICSAMQRLKVVLQRSAVILCSDDIYRNNALCINHI